MTRQLYINISHSCATTTFRRKAYKEVYASDAPTTPIEMLTDYCRRFKQMSLSPHEWTCHHMKCILGPASPSTNIVGSWMLRIHPVSYHNRLASSGVKYRTNDNLTWLPELLRPMSAILRSPCSVEYYERIRAKLRLVSDLRPAQLVLNDRKWGGLLTVVSSIVDLFTIAAFKLQLESPLGHEEKKYIVEKHIEWELHYEMQSAKNRELLEIYVRS